MTGLPAYNYPAFNALARQLRLDGHDVENPAENPAPACGTWEGFMKMAIGQLIRCEAVMLLPGWADSSGACLEVRLAHALGLTVLSAGVGNCEA
jgi:hypothetical protein